MGADGGRELSRQQRRRCEFAGLRVTHNAPALQLASCAVLNGYDSLRGFMVLFDFYEERQTVFDLDSHALAVGEARQLVKKRDMLLAEFEVGDVSFSTGTVLTSGQLHRSPSVPRSTQVWFTAYDIKCNPTEVDQLALPNEPLLSFRQLFLVHAENSRKCWLCSRSGNCIYGIEYRGDCSRATRAQPECVRRRNRKAERTGVGGRRGSIIPALRNSIAVVARRVARDDLADNGVSDLTLFFLSKFFSPANPGKKTKHAYE